VTETPCPHCGEPVERRQLVCLNCGGRVALKERTPWAREPVTAMAALLVVVIVIGAGLFGFAISELTSGDGDGGGDRAAEQAAAERPAGEGPAVVSGGEQTARTAEGAAPAEEAPRETETTPTETTPAESPAEEPPAEGGGANAVPGWPAGLRAHTVVLVSSSDRAAALNVAKEARGSGLEAGLIRSDPYDLGTGLWIVYSGRFTTPEGAQRQAAQLSDRYPGAYPQLVQRSQ
jgi:DNA-directed RNA polymerase subunit RPC12/RpoP